MQILRHFLQKEDLNLETLRWLAKDLQIDTTYTQPQTQRRKSKTASDDSPGSEEAVQNDSEPDTEEIGDLHEQLGCLMQDSLGEYRSCYFKQWTDSS
jgi:aldehyde dehydrogenase (NAD+)